jgi:flagellar biosynthesis/type III secretory pathway chaperone
MSGVADGGLLNECALRADEIIGLLEEESTALRSFNSALLMQLLGRKEHLFNELRLRIESLAADRKLNLSQDHDSVRAPLRDRLRTIARLNEANRAFIENTLSFYQDFLNCLSPCGYVRGQEGRAERTQITMRGIALKKEI